LNGFKVPNGKDFAVVILTVFVIGLAQAYHREKLKSTRMETSLSSYRISTARNDARLNTDKELKIIASVCEEVPGIIPLMWSWRQWENGYPGHEMGCKKHYGFKPNEQYYTAKAIIFQEAARYCLDEKHYDEFLKQLANRVNAKDKEQWYKGVRELMKGAMK